MPSILHLEAEMKFEASSRKASWCWAQFAAAPRRAVLRRVALARRARVHERQMDVAAAELYAEIRRSEHYRVYEDPAA